MKAARIGLYAFLLGAALFFSIPLLIVAALWYLILVTILSVGQAYIEKYYSRGWTNSAPAAA